jgi:hypothetical protein
MTSCTLVTLIWQRLWALLEKVLYDTHRRKRSTFLEIGRIRSDNYPFLEPYPQTTIRAGICFNGSSILALGEHDCSSYPAESSEFLVEISHIVTFSSR